MPRDWDSSTIGLRIEQGRHSVDWICSVGRWDLVKISAGKWDKDPLRDKLFLGNSAKLKNKLTLYESLHIFVCINFL